MRPFILALAFAFAFMGSAEARTWRVAPGPNAQTELQAALRSAAPGDDVRLDRGRYDLNAGLVISKGITLRGDGRERTILAFTARQAAGLSVTGDGAALRDFAVTGALDGIKIANAANVLVQQIAASGASGAGMKIGQSRNVIVRDSALNANGVGILVENVTAADLFGNAIMNNGAGVIVLNAPGAEEGRDIRIFRNEIGGNNNARSDAAADPNQSIALATGVAIIAGRNVHIFDNTIGRHGGVNILIAAYRDRFDDARFNPLPRDIAIHDNRMGRQGFAPSDALKPLAENGTALPDVLWDGAMSYSAAGAMPRAGIVRILMRNNSETDGDGAPTFLSLGLAAAGVDFIEGAPDNTLANARDIPEPREVRLP